MVSNLGKILKKINNEKFKGNNPDWRKTKWGDVGIFSAQDKDNWYYKHGRSIYVQAKTGNYELYCYGCNSKIEFKEQGNPVWSGKWFEGSGVFGEGEVRTKRIPYCPICEKEPPESGIILD